MDAGANACNTGTDTGTIIAERAGLASPWSDFYGNLFPATKKYQTVTLPDRQSKPSCFALSPWWNCEIVASIFSSLSCMYVVIFCL
jgi:hypothetical protein